MRGYGLYLLRRLLQFVLVVFIGINVTYVITHATPIDPVEQTVTAATAFGTTSPEAIDMMRRSLQDLYGTGGSALHQWLAFWGRILVGDFGPSLSAFPTPVSTLIGRALPWTAGLMLVATVLSWGLGNLLGGLAGYYRRNRLLKFAGIVAMGVHPVPYYIVAFVLLILFGYVWPVLPITGAYAQGLQPGFSPDFIGSVLRHSLLPAASLVLVGIGGWFMGMRSLVSNVVTEDYVVYAELAGVKHRRILGAYIMRNALAPQVTGLAMTLGAIFNGAIITEQVFGYPGLGSLLVAAVHAGDYSLVIGVTTISILAVSFAVLLVDLLYPLLDPRVQAR
ncbi:ABC transporter permease [Roseomonas elaeocarpi]|uniref:ABC transporter permease n=1 Tax=Roseomonas elaeocarpi TaxID=907779 RepID=A0ABV6JWM7_9PROT